MKHRAAIVVTAAVTLVAGMQASAALVDTRIDGNADAAVADGVISANEYGLANAYQYLGGGGGFSGALGAGALYMESDPSNLYIGFQPGNTLNDIVVIHMDTRLGGFS